jgi:hypothetical protein
MPFLSFFDNPPPNFKRSLDDPLDPSMKELSFQERLAVSHRMAWVHLDRGGSATVDNINFFHWPYIHANEMERNAALREWVVGHGPGGPPCTARVVSAERFTPDMWHEYNSTFCDDHPDRLPEGWPYGPEEVKTYWLQQRASMGRPPPGGRVHVAHVARDRQGSSVNDGAGCSGSGDAFADAAVGEEGEQQQRRGGKERCTQ